MGTRAAANRAGRRRVVAIGLSRFDDAELRPLPFAAADARAFASAFRTESARALTDAEATAGAVMDALGSLATAEPEDELYLFIATHPLRDETKFGLRVFDESVEPGNALGGIWNGPARRVVLLLDLLRRGADAAGPTAAEAADLFPPREGRTLLLADDGSRGSHISGELQAGIWAAHVTAAFGGEVARAREADGTLTAGSLRSFLADEIPRSLARAYTDGRRQSPVLLAASDEEVLADPVEPADRQVSAKPPLAGVRFLSEREMLVKLLGGFRKSVHSVPSDTFASSKEWVRRLAEPDLAKEVEEAAAGVRRHLGYKRRDVRADGPADGSASVLTPDFAYHVTAGQHPERPDRAVLRRTLAEIRNADILGSPAFAEAFPQGFQKLHCPFDAPADLESLIDALEDAAPAGLARLDYPTDLAYCDLELSGFDGRVRIERGGITVAASGPASPSELAARFAHVKRLLGAAGI